MTDQNKQFIEQILSASQDKQKLFIQGGASKQFMHNFVASEQVVSTSEHSGVINYLPSELTITVKSGTLLSEVKQILLDNGQELAFEPPSFSENATIGGVIAAGISGLRRPYTGAARDFVLGCDIINGKGELLHFGGEVMKNVAGYDVSRLMVGAFGSLGLITQISLKVLPLAKYEKSLSINLPGDQFIEFIHNLQKKGYPISASCHYQELAYVRLSGTEKSITAVINSLKDMVDIIDTDIDSNFWSSLNEQRHSFFQDSFSANTRDLWRISLPTASSNFDEMLQLQEKDMQIIDWGGACRWIYTDQPLDMIRSTSEECGGTAQIYRDNKQNSQDNNRFHPLNLGVFSLHQRIKQRFDPNNILNSSIMYTGL